ncbi:unnamed protein product [Rotaria sordida]|uniref:Uncharacterized protein n=1 Tax=Rotaria sordida TaxID=392033 RepID=A0A815EZL8_9BILA|nr:unnamed protein product [Rotaria sordida]CAF1322313.1 unnamed protein product [Rotaria sordida]
MQQNNSSSINGSNEIVIAKFNYNAQENHELSIVKNERLLLLDDSCLWWKVKRIDTDEIGYIPSNFARREKRSLLDKIISKRINKKQTTINNEHIVSLALVKFRYDAESEDEISLNKGTWVSVLEKKNDGWWLIQYEKQRGWFPSNYLIEKTTDGLNSLSLLNQLKYHHSSSSSNGLSSSSSANSNIIDINHNHQQNRHNSHPSHITNTNDEYLFVMKSSKFAHSDGKLDTCLTFNQQQQQQQEEKNNSWSGLIQYDKTNSNCLSPSILNHEPLTLIEGLTTLTLKKSLNDSTYDNEIWYYGSITRDDAEKILKFYSIEKGEFLIRNSERKIGNYSLSIRADNDIVRHFLIESTDDNTRFIIGKRSFKSINDLIEHYKIHPVYDADPNNKLYLNRPLIINNSNHQL